MYVIRHFVLKYICIYVLCILISINRFVINCIFIVVLLFRPIIRVTFKLQVFHIFILIISIPNIIYIFFIV